MGKWALSLVKKNKGLHPTTIKKKGKKSQDAQNAVSFLRDVLQSMSAAPCCCADHPAPGHREKAALARTADRIRRWCGVSPDRVPESPQRTEVSRGRVAMGTTRGLACTVQTFSLWQCVCIVFSVKFAGRLGVGGSCP